MTKNPLYTTKASFLITEIKEIERFNLALESAELKATSTFIEEISLRTGEIVHECDTVALPKRLIPAARNIADAAWMLNDFIGKPSEVHEDGSYQFEASEFTLVQDYAHKALESLKMPAQYYGADVETLAVAGGLYL